MPGLEPEAPLDLTLDHAAQGFRQVGGAVLALLCRPPGRGATCCAALSVRTEWRDIVWWRAVALRGAQIEAATRRALAAQRTGWRRYWGGAPTAAAAAAWPTTTHGAAAHPARLRRSGCYYQQYTDRQRPSNIPSAALINLRICSISCLRSLRVFLGDTQRRLEVGGGVTMTLRARAQLRGCAATATVPACLAG
jgi:hypothetical protein